MIKKITFSFILLITYQAIAASDKQCSPITQETQQKFGLVSTRYIPVLSEYISEIVKFGNRMKLNVKYCAKSKDSEKCKVYTHNSSDGTFCAAIIDQGLSYHLDILKSENSGETFHQCTIEFKESNTVGSRIVEIEFDRSFIHPPLMLDRFDSGSIKAAEEKKKQTITDAIRLQYKKGVLYIKQDGLICESSRKGCDYRIKRVIESSDFGATWKVVPGSYTWSTAWKENNIVKQGFPSHLLTQEPTVEPNITCELVPRKKKRVILE